VEGGIWRVPKIVGGGGIQQVSPKHGGKKKGTRERKKPSLTNNTLGKHGKKKWNLNEDLKEDTRWQQGGKKKEDTLRHVWEWESDK